MREFGKLSFAAFIKEVILLLVMLGVASRNDFVSSTLIFYLVLFDFFVTLQVSASSSPSIN